MLLNKGHSLSSCFWSFSSSSFPGSAAPFERNHSGSYSSISAYPKHLPLSNQLLLPYLHECSEASFFPPAWQLDILKHPWYSTSSIPLLPWPYHLSLISPTLSPKLEIQGVILSCLAMSTWLPQPLSLSEVGVNSHVTLYTSQQMHEATSNLYSC